MYNKKIMQLFINPNNCGLVHGANATCYITHEVSGDVIKMYAVIDDNTIIDAGFKACGSPALIASLSALTDILKNKTVDQALALTNNDILSILEEMPEDKVYCMDFARLAVETTIADYFERIEKEEKRQNKKAKKNKAENGDNAELNDNNDIEDVFADGTEDFYYYESDGEE